MRMTRSCECNSTARKFCIPRVANRLSSDTEPMRRGNFREHVNCRLLLAEVLYHLDNALGIGLRVEDGAPVSRRAQVGGPGAGFFFKRQDWRNAASGEAVELDRGAWFGIYVEPVKSA